MTVEVLFNNTFDHKKLAKTEQKWNIYLRYSSAIENYKTNRWYKVHVIQLIYINKYSYFYVEDLFTVHKLERYFGHTASRVYDLVTIVESGLCRFYFLFVLQSKAFIIVHVKQNLANADGLIWSLAILLMFFPRLGYY